MLFAFIFNILTYVIIIGFSHIFLSSNEISLGFNPGDSTILIELSLDSEVVFFPTEGTYPGKSDVGVFLSVMFIFFDNKLTRFSQNI